MSSASAETTTFLPLILYSLAVLGLVGAMVLLSHLLGARRRDRATDEPFESGVVSFGGARFHVTVPFYLVAILFVIFDLEAVFLFAWAISLRESGWPGFIEVVIFIVILLAALVYLWRIGALDWKRDRPKRASELESS